MDGTFTVSSQCDRSPLQGGTPRCLLLFYCSSTTVHSLYQRQQLNWILFPSLTLRTDGLWHFQRRFRRNGAKLRRIRCYYEAYVVMRLLRIDSQAPQHAINNSRRWESIFHASYFVGRALSFMSLLPLIWGSIVVTPHPMTADCLPGERS